MGPSVYFYLQGLSYCNDYLSVNTDAKGPSVNMGVKSIDLSQIPFKE